MVELENRQAAVVVVHPSQRSSHHLPQEPDHLYYQYYHYQRMSRSRSRSRSHSHSEKMMRTRFPFWEFPRLRDHSHRT